MRILQCPLSASFGCCQHEERPDDLSEKATITILKSPDALVLPKQSKKLPRGPTRATPKWSFFAFVEPYAQQRHGVLMYSPYLDSTLQDRQKRGSL